MANESRPAFAPCNGPAHASTSARAAKRCRGTKVLRELNSSAVRKPAGAMGVVRKTAAASGVVRKTAAARGVVRKTAAAARLGRRIVYVARASTTACDGTMSNIPFQATDPCGRWRNPTAAHKLVTGHVIARQLVPERAGTGLGPGPNR